MNKGASFLLLLFSLFWLSACNLPMPYTAQTPAASLPAVPEATLTLAPAATEPPVVPITPLAPAPAPTGTPLPGAPTPLASATPPGGAAATPQGGASATQPTGPAPETVVMTYLEAYPTNDAAMLSTLSAARRTNLPKGGPGRLLQVQGDLQGFAIQSGSEVPDPPQAVVVVALRAGGKDSVRRFTLLRENGAWVIASISS